MTKTRQQPLPEQSQRLARWSVALFFMCRRLLLVGIVVMARAPVEAQQPGVEVELGGGLHVPISKWIDPGLIELADGPVVNLGVVRWGEKWGVAARVLVGFGGAVRLDDGPAVGSHYQGRYAHPTYIQLLLRYRTRWGVFFGFGGGVDALGRPHVGTIEVLKSIVLTERASIHLGGSTLLPLQVTPVALLAWKL